MFLYFMATCLVLFNQERMPFDLYILHLQCKKTTHEYSHRYLLLAKYSLYKGHAVNVTV